MNITQGHNKNQTSFGNYYTVTMPLKAFKGVDTADVNKFFETQINQFINRPIRHEKSLYPFLDKGQKKAETVFATSGDSYTFHVFTKQHIGQKPETIAQEPKKGLFSFLKQQKPQNKPDGEFKLSDLGELGKIVEQMEY